VNMTDTMAALSSLIEVDCPERKKILAAFYKKWKDNALVVDKWFTLQAMSFSLEEVMQLMQHPAFDIKNPNKVYALIRPFCQANLVNFHAAHGAGYVFLSNIVLQLNDFNPQIAARMVTPLTEWRRYDAKRQSLMREQLEFILTKKNLSKDVYELVTKSLGEESYVENTH
jgi:aminopeptidase N